MVKKYKKLQYSLANFSSRVLSKKLTHHVIRPFKSLQEGQAQNHLGIYLGKDTATVVCLDLEGGDHKVLDCFSVSAEGQQEASSGATTPGLANLIAEACAERVPRYQDSEAAVALDCAMFMQHNVHSDFSDPRQIAATIRFDTEEALSTDITDLAIAFKITSSDQTGSELSVFTAERKVLSDVLVSLQNNNIDPITIEPDVNCLSRFILQNVYSLESRQVGTLFCVLSQRSGYFIAFTGLTEVPAMRTFLVDPTQDRGDLLAREVPVTAALLGTGEPINRLKVLDSTDSVDYQQLSEKLGIEVSGVDWLGSAAAGPETIADCAGQVDFAIAYGAALAHLEKARSVDFRSDFSPYQGKKVRLQKALKFASISVTVLVLIVGLYFQLQLLKTNAYRGKLRDKFAGDYSPIMLGQKLPDKFTAAKTKLGSELRRIRNVRSGQLSITGEESVSAKLALVLEAFNKCAKPTNLNIDSTSITARSITIAGNTSSRANTLKLFEAIKGKLNILQQRLELKNGRDNFSITVEPKR